MADKNQIKKILAGQLPVIKPSEIETARIQQTLNEFTSSLKSEIKKSGVSADVFVGGSLAKDTIIRKKEHYDIDIFVRFNYSKYKRKSKQLSEILEKILLKLSKKMKLKLEKMHGSRDYFNIMHRGILIEIIPILRIKKASEAMNITDISPLHVLYVVKKFSGNKKLTDEIRLAKTFCFIQDCYGAESYIKGFSGYSLELLAIHFGSFINLLKAAEKWSLDQKIIIDPANYYKHKNDVLVLLNEAKLQSPLILIDPVQQERNVTAALSSQTFENFLKSVHRFMKNPNAEFFRAKIDSSEEIRKIAVRKKAVFSELIIESSSDRIDVAGAKALRLSNFLVLKMKKQGFSVLLSKFDFDTGNKKGILYLVYKNPSAKMEIKGPPVALEKFASEFKKKYGKTSVRNGKLYAIAKSKVKNLDEFLKYISKDYKKELKSMLIKKFELKK